MNTLNNENWKTACLNLFPNFISYDTKDGEQVYKLTTLDSEDGKYKIAYFNPYYDEPVLYESKSTHWAYTIENHYAYLAHNNMEISTIEESGYNLSNKVFLEKQEGSKFKGYK